MFYLSDFKVYPLRGDNHNENSENRIERFSVLFNSNGKSETKLSKYSIANAARPLVYAASICGTQLFRYSEHDLQKTNVIQKLYCIFVVTSIILLVILVKPAAWLDTSADIPLNILTKTQTSLMTTEFLYSLAIITFRKNNDCINLFMTLDNVDAHFDTSKKFFKDRQIIAAILSLAPILIVTLSISVKKFDIRNMGPYLAIFESIVQGSLITFFLLNIYFKYIMFNKILLSKTKTQKMIVFRESKFDIILKTIFRELKFVENIAHERFCWLELMQIYDKISDCMQIFNNIFMWQIFIMFNTWFLTSLLLICRSLSPTLKKFNVLISDAFLYTTLNSRQMIFAMLCEIFMKERKKTISILIQILQEQCMDTDYYDQVQSLLNLVETKKMEITANVFVVNIPTVMNFSGRAISFSVLMIQYFYMNQFSQ